MRVWTQGVTFERRHAVAPELAGIRGDSHNRTNVRPRPPYFLLRNTPKARPRVTHGPGFGGEGDNWIR